MRAQFKVVGANLAELNAHAAEALALLVGDETVSFSFMLTATLDSNNAGSWVALVEAEIDETPGVGFRHPSGLMPA